MSETGNKQPAQSSSKHTVPLRYYLPDTCPLMLTHARVGLGLLSGLILPRILNILGIKQRVKRPPSPCPPSNANTLPRIARPRHTIVHCG